MFRIYEPETENLYKMIAEEALEESGQGRPILIILDSINATNDMKKSFLQSANLIQGISVRADRRSIARAGQPGTITVSTIAAGRGTDIKLTSESIKAGGLHVIIAKLPPQGRTLVQNIGRGSRQGQPRSATIYMTASDHFGKSLNMDPNTINLFRLQKRFSKFLVEHWPWMTAQDNIYVESPIYDFGDSVDDVFKKKAELIVDKFFWPKKELTEDG